jgi:pimeloyl-ACP methyl ester carboxylesterase
VLLVDLLGFGKSPKPWTTYSVDRHVAALHGVLADAGPLTLVGHSLGAILAIAYAAQYPGNVTGLALLGLPYFRTPEEAKRFLRSRSTLDRWVLTNMVFASIACVLTRHVMRRLLPKLLPNMPREVIEDYVEHTWRSATSTVREVIYRYDLARAAERLPGDLPVALLHGDRDATAPLTGVKELVHRHPGWQLHVLSGGDHNLLLRDPGWCLSRIRALIDASASRAFPNARRQLVS